MGQWWQGTYGWKGLDKCPQFVNLIMKFRQVKNTLNILVVGKCGVGKYSLIKSIVGQDFLGKNSPMDPNNRNNLHSQNSQVLESRTEMMTASLEDILEYRPTADRRTTGKYEFTFESEDYGFTLNFIYTPFLIDAGDMACDFVEVLTRYLPEKHIDVLLYVDRADVYRMADLDLMTTILITKLFGEDVWKKALIVLTHSDALDKIEDDNFAERRKKLLFSSMAAARCIATDVLFRRKVFFVDNTKICKTGELIYDDDNLPINLIEESLDIARSINDPHVPLKPIWQMSLRSFYDGILDDCKERYFAVINDFGVYEGLKQPSWETFTDEDVSGCPPPVACDPNDLSGSLRKLLVELTAKGLKSYSILVMGTSGVGKSSLINRIIGKNLFTINEFQGSLGVVVWACSIGEFTLNIMETPGFIHFGTAHPSFYDVVERFREKYVIDALIYVDRLDEYKWDFSRCETIRSIANFFGPSIMNSILIVLTHGKSISGEQYASFVKKRCTEITHTMLQAVSPLMTEDIFQVGNVETVVVENGRRCGKNGGEQEDLSYLYKKLCGVSLREDRSTSGWARLELQDIWLDSPSDLLQEFYSLAMPVKFIEYSRKRKKARSKRNTNGDLSQQASQASTSQQEASTSQQGGTQRRARAQPKKSCPTRKNLQEILSRRGVA